MDLTSAHWIYLLAMIVIIAVMVCRKNIVVPAVAATFVTAWLYTGNLATGLSSVFNASLVAASELFSIFLIIAVITRLLARFLHRRDTPCSSHELRTLTLRSERGR